MSKLGNDSYTCRQCGKEWCDAFGDPQKRICPYCPVPRTISYDEPHHQRPVRVDGRYAGFVRLTMGGHWTAYSSRQGCGVSPFATESSAEQWVRDEYAKGPVAGYSR